VISGTGSYRLSTLDAGRPVVPLPLGFLHWIQLAGTTAMVLVDYCPGARLVSLMPWNRRVPLTLGLVVRTFVRPPVRGSILDAPA